MVLDHVEDMDERPDQSSEAEVEADDLEEGAEESGSEASESTDEPPGGTLPSENEAGRLTGPEPGAPAPEAPPGDPEPLSGRQLVEYPQEEAAEAVSDYETLVSRGKEMKERGQIQEALNCLVKALDIKSADPEIMLMTLSLYKQLNTT